MCHICAAVRPLDDYCPYQSAANNTEVAAFDPSTDPASGATWVEWIEAPDQAHFFNDRGVMTVNSTFDGGMAYVGDQDYVRVDLEMGTTYTIQVYSFSMQPQFQLYGFNSATNNADFLTSLTHSYVDVNGTTYAVSEIEVTATETRPYWINVFDDLSEGNYLGVGGAYTISVSETSNTGPGGLEEWSLDQISERITDTGWAFFEGTRRFWEENTITYSTAGLGADAKQMAEWAFDAWALLTGINFKKKNGLSDPLDAMITLDDEDPGVAYANAQLKANGNMEHSNINIAQDWEGRFGYGLNNHLFQTYIHEIGHALGLAHAGDYNAGNGQPVTYPESVLYENDTLNLTIMSYITQSMNTNDNADFARVVTPQIVDVIAMDDLYGLAAEIYHGDTKYGVGSNVGGYMDIVFSGLTDSSFTHQYWDSTQPVSFTIVDTGGLDKINFSTDTTNQIIDLRQKQISDIYGVKGSMIIARDTKIENYTAGSGNDDITGNTSNNLIRGNNGKDTIRGEKGNDDLRGQNGADELRGGAGKDKIKGGNGDDTIKGGNGADKIWGDAGNDMIFGNGGADIIVFKKNDGKDTIMDFQDNKDTLRIDDALWSGTLSKQQVINQFGNENNGDAILNFGNGQKITIEDMSLADLKNDMEFI